MSDLGGNITRFSKVLMSQKKKSKYNFRLQSCSSEVFRVNAVLYNMCLSAVIEMLAKCQPAPVHSLHLRKCVIMSGSQ